MWNDSLLKAYLAREQKALLLLLIAFACMGGIGVLYSLPSEPLCYAAVLTLAVAAVLFGFGFVRYGRQCRELERLLASVDETELPMPEPGTRLEADYQNLVRALAASRNSTIAAESARRRDMVEYYTLWAHQIKTPIAAMRLLLQTQPGPQNLALDAELLEIEQYVGMVLSYLRLESEASDLVLGRFALDQLVRGAVRKYSRLFILKKITLAYTGTEAEVLTDQKWFAFVLEQLLSNALKYTPPGGRVSITAAADGVTVRDTGIGIRAEDLPRVFEKGFTGYNGREEQKSTGLGLYLCRRVVRRLGHTISLTSAPGSGTAVCIGFAAGKPAYD